MIYQSLLYYFVAISLYIISPLNRIDLTSFIYSFLLNLIFIFIFYKYINHFFKKIAYKLSDAEDENYIEKSFVYYKSRFILFALLFFVFQIFVLNIKSLVFFIPVLRKSEFLSNFSAIFILFLDFVIVWYVGYKNVLKPLLNKKFSLKDYIISNLKFELAILIPLVLVSLIIDLLSLLNKPFIDNILKSSFYQIIFFSLFIVLFSVFAPFLITKLWDCEEIEDKKIKDLIENYFKRIGLRVRKVFFWNALNKELLTAGIMGVIPRYRYLLITPRLYELLTIDEILAVVSHEAGHVKHKHLWYYILFFISFIVLSLTGLNQFFLLILTTDFGSELFYNASNSNVDIINIVMVVLTILWFVVFFRYIFGYFMRNFERQADLFCFKSGVNPEALISSFYKLKYEIGEPKNKKNWHHYSLSERIDFINECIEDESKIKKHDKSLRIKLISYFSVILLIVALWFNPFMSNYNYSLNLKVMAKYLEKKAEEKGNDYKLLAIIGSIHYELKNWDKVKSFYEKSLKIKYEQSDVLNNLAWFYIKCDDKKYIDCKRGLKLAIKAFDLKKESHIADTLAEAYYCNGEYKKAYYLSKTALNLAKDNFSYYENQVEKFKQILKARNLTID